MVLFQNCVRQSRSSHQDGHHSAVALLLKAALIQVSDYRSFLRACKIITYRFFCIHVARFLLLCHICDCTFVTGVCKLKRFIDFANISIRTSCFFSLFVTKKPINITQPSKKTPKQSISYDCVAVTLARITF